MDHCKGLKLLFFPCAVFHGVHSYYTILRIFAESIMALDVVWMKLLGLAFDI